MNHSFIILTTKNYIIRYVAMHDDINVYTHNLESRNIYF